MEGVSANGKAISSRRIELAAPHFPASSHQFVKIDRGAVVRNRRRLVSARGRRVQAVPSISFQRNGNCRFPVCGWKTLGAHARRLFSLSSQSDSLQSVNLHLKPGIAPECFYASGDTTLWVGMSDGGILQMRDGKVVRRALIMHTAINFMLDDRDGVLIGTTGGVYRLSKNENTPLPFCSASNGLAGKLRFDWDVDLEGNLWLGLWGHGIAKLVNRSVFSYPIKEMTFPPNGSAAAMDSSEHLWVVSSKGILELWKGENGQWQSTLHKELSKITNQKPFTLLFDPPSHLWAGFEKGDIVCFALTPHELGPSKLNVFHRWRQGKEYRSGGAPMFLYKDREGYSGAAYPMTVESLFFDPKRKKPFVRSYMAQDGMPDNSVRAIFEDRKGNFWFGGYDDGLTFLPADKNSSAEAGGSLSRMACRICRFDQCSKTVRESFGSAPVTGGLHIFAIPRFILFR